MSFMASPSLQGWMSGTDLLQPVMHASWRNGSRRTSNLDISLLQQIRALRLEQQ